MCQPLNEVSASFSLVAVNVVKELENKERCKNLIFYNVPEPSTSWKEYNVNLCKATFDLNIQVAKSFCLRKRVSNKQIFLNMFEQWWN